MVLKKILSIVVLTLILCTQTGSVLAEATVSQDTTETPKVIQDCKTLEPKYPDDPKKIDETKIDFSKPYKDKFELNFRVTFEKASNQYHLYMECVFEGMVTAMLSSAGGDTSGIFAANAPDLPEFMKPESACLKEDKLTAVLKSGSPETLLSPLLATYNTYVDYLKMMLQVGRSNVTVEENGVPLSIAEINARREFLSTTLVDDEIQDSLAALDGAFNSLKEMRKAFAMHIHFQCMLRNLELYRHAMENLRKVVSGLPSVIENASMH